MAHLSDFDLRQMDDDWQDKQPDVVIRSLLKRTLDDLRVARDRLNQNPTNSSRPSGSMPPWQSSADRSKGGNDDPDDILLPGGVDSDSTDNNNDSDTPEHPKGDAPQSNTDAAAQTSLPPEAQSKPTHVLDSRFAHFTSHILTLRTQSLINRYGHSEQTQNAYLHCVQRCYAYVPDCCVDVHCNSNDALKCLEHHLGCWSRCCTLRIPFIYLVKFFVFFLQCLSYLELHHAQHSQANAEQSDQSFDSRC